MTDTKTSAELRSVAKAICRSRTCEGMSCCEWPANMGRQHDCPVNKGLYDDAARDAIAALLSAPQAGADGGVREALRLLRNDPTVPAWIRTIAKSALASPVPAMPDREKIAEAGLRHAEGLTAQLVKPDWKPSRSHIEQARNSIAKLSALISAQQPVATVERSPTLGSSIDLLIGFSFKSVETLNRSAKHRYYLECGCCGGTDENRDHYKPDIDKVEHTSDCPLARDLPILRSIGLESAALAQQPRSEGR